MPIVTSEIVDDSAQTDGRRYITECHTDHIGIKHRFVWMALAGQVATTILASRATWLLAWLKEREIAANLESAATAGASAVITLVYSTAAENVAALRAMFRTLTAERACRMAEYLLTLTDAQIKNAFSMNQAQCDAFQTRLASKVAALTTMLAQAGE